MMYLQYHNWKGMGCSFVSQCEDPALPLHHRVSTGGTSEQVRVICVCPEMNFLCSLTVTIYRHCITEQKASQPKVSYLLLGKHLIFNSNLLCEVKCNFWTLGWESWPLQLLEAISCLFFSFIKAFKKFISGLWFADGSPKLSCLLFLLYSAKKLLSDSNIALCIVWISPHFYDSCSQGSLLPYLPCSCFFSPFFNSFACGIPTHPFNQSWTGLVYYISFSWKCMILCFLIYILYKYFNMVLSAFILEWPHMFYKIIFYCIFCSIYLNIFCLP